MSTATSSPIDPLNPQFPGTVSVNLNQPPVSYNHIAQNFAKLFALETLSVLNDRVIANVGVSRSRYESSRVQNNFNQVTGVATADTNVFPTSVAYKNLVQFGLVVKPLPKLPVNNVAEQTAALWSRYKFTDHNMLRGVAISIGANYLSKRAINDNSGSQVFFGYLPARTIVDASITYTTKSFTYQLNVDNVLNKKYIYASRSKSGPGARRADQRPRLRHVPFLVTPPPVRVLGPPVFRASLFCVGRHRLATSRAR
jgi:outer membrane receptor for monomeric catechols